MADPSAVGPGGLPVGAELLVIAAAGAVGFIVATVAFAASERAHTRTTMLGIDEIYDLGSSRDADLASPIVKRVIGPMRTGLVRLGSRVSPTDYTSRLRTMMLRAGRTENAADPFLAKRFLFVLAAPIAFVLCYRFVPLGGTVAAGTGICIALALIFLPQTRLGEEVKKRETRVRRELPDIMDLLVLSVEAGLGFTSALVRTVAMVPGELSAEFGTVLGEIRAGATRSEALGRLGERVQLPEIRSFVNALRQADQLGISIAPTLREQSEEIRERHRLEAQEKAQKAPVKMLVPMVFCIFPPLFMITIGPAGLKLAGGGF